MSIFDSVKTLFGGRKTLADFSMDDLDRERIRLEQSERAFLGDLKKIENKKREWFSKGAEASGREQLIAARKVKELDVEASNIDKNMSVISRQARTINALIQLKKNEKLFRSHGLSKDIYGMDIADLEKGISDSGVEGEWNVKKLEDLLTAVEGNDPLPISLREGEDVADILKAMQEAQAGRSVDETLNELNKTMRSKDANEDLDKPV